MKSVSKKQISWLGSLTKGELRYFLGFYTDKDGHIKLLNRKEGDKFTVAGKDLTVGETTTMSGGAGLPPEPELKWWDKIF